jgi:hypothetical protein
MHALCNMFVVNAKWKYYHKTIKPLENQGINLNVLNCLPNVSTWVINQTFLNITFMQPLVDTL